MREPRPSLPRVQHVPRTGRALAPLERYVTAPAGRTRTGGLRRLGKGLVQKPESAFSGRRPVVASRFAGALMGSWLVGHVTIFGGQLQNWMLIALALIAVAIVFAWFSSR
jgi:hypothetical protein